MVPVNGMEKGRHMAGYIRMGNSLSKYRHLAAKSSVVEPGSQSDVRTPVKIRPSR